jgi:putrescine aminotransferase
LMQEFATICAEFPTVFAPGSVLGAMATIGLRKLADRHAVQSALFKRGVMCHSISLIEPAVIKFLPCLNSDASVIAELATALRGFATERRP